MSKKIEVTKSVICGRFSQVFECVSEKTGKKLYFINLYVLGGRFRLFAPKFEVLPDTDYLVTLELTYFSVRDSKGYTVDCLKPVQVLEVEPI